MFGAPLTAPLLAATPPLGALGWLALLAMAAAGWWLSRRSAPVARAQTIGLGPKHAVHVLELAGRRWLIGTGPGGPPSLLAELEVPAAGPTEPAAGLPPAVSVGTTGGSPARPGWVEPALGPTLVPCAPARPPGPPLAPPAPVRPQGVDAA